MNIKLVVTDMDGTFLDNESNFDREAFDELKNNLDAKNIRFVFCTGKQCERVENIVGDLSKDTFIIGDSATRIKYNGEFLYTASIQNELGLSIINSIKEIDESQTIIACTEKVAFALESVPDDERKFIHGSYQNVEYIKDFKEIESDFLKITVHDAKGNCMKTAESIKYFENEVYIVASEDYWIDITDLGVNKGTTINRIQNILNIDPSETIAFGDGLNDIDLFKAAKYKVAMDNAYSELKKEANLIAINNNENGVIATLQLLI
ncbi:Cof-type HAD-IIB family hydrolase [Mammaliicoccus sp. Dog046]|uniref:Cof-type HAD-IIB family hydrolase n=1 Tax=Mammaliicoccus sp. Dog046 TaxID=3034233 RepID=UPI002B2587A7|nr:Cof-type HAD-IIB family hydrolase [Mammaliicoccus sp. Dog046]WQK84509.1 Cof-type HAD-IIB family hydrolase [Mammaliicoccus sp. Dog046]